MPITDNFKDFSTGLGGPVTNAVVVSPSDSADLPHMTRALYVGGAGNIRVTLAAGSVVDFTGLVAGWHPLRVARVHATGTTATHIHGCW